MAGGAISALYAASPTDVFACDSIIRWHWDGRAWGTNMPEDTGAEDAWAAPGGPLWVVSNHGWIDRWDGQAWTEVFTRGTGHQFLSIRGTDASHIWAAGIDLLRYDGSNWWTARQSPDSCWATTPASGRRARRTCGRSGRKA